MGSRGSTSCAVRARPQMIVFTARRCAQPSRPFHETRAPHRPAMPRSEPALRTRRSPRPQAFSYGHPGRAAPRSTPRLTQAQTSPARTGGTDLTLESGRPPPLDGRSDTNDPPIDRSLGRSLLRSELTTSESRELLLSEPYPGLANSAPP